MLFTAPKADHQREFAYDMTQDPDSLHSSFLLATNKQMDNIITIFRRHGAIFLQTPLLTPQFETTADSDTVVLLERDGLTVTLPFDLTFPFARFLARQPVSLPLRRYCVHRVFRSKKTSGQPFQPAVCTFDIVDVADVSMVPDAEVVKAVTEIVEGIHVW